MQDITLDKSKLPKHIAIIMDGNGRWAKANALPRFEGHRSGVQTVREITQTCSELEIQHLTLFTFSSENWERPISEVNALIKLLSHSIQKEIKKLVENNIRFTFIGNVHKFNTKIQDELLDAFKKTKNNSGLNLNLALSYGSREEILNATKQLCKKAQAGKINIENIDENSFSKELYTKNMPNPDYLIRTGGDYRISNFLLWQIAYAELYISEKFWPDFNKFELLKALSEFQKRERRFGKISSQIKLTND